MSETDAIWRATWIQNGAAYALVVECSRAEDARCKGKPFVRELVDSLVYVGGPP